MSIIHRASGRTASARLATGLLALAAALSPFAAAAEDLETGTIRISHPWSRATPPGATTGAGYLALGNAGPADDRLVSATSPAANVTEIHEMRVENGVMTMRRLADGVAVPAGGGVALEPGGTHLMLIGLKAPLRAGETVPVTLRFAKAGPVDVALQVGGLGSSGPGAEAGGDMGGTGHGGGHAGHDMGAMGR